MTMANLLPVKSNIIFSSTRQDDLFVVHVQNDYASLLECMFKTEFLTTLGKRYKESSGRELRIDFTDR